MGTQRTAHMATMPKTLMTIAGLCLGTAMPLLGQVPIRPLGAIDMTSSLTVGPGFGIRALKDGSVLVNDGVNRRLVLLDSMLTNAVLVADSSHGSRVPYGRDGAAMVAYQGDTTLFLDATASSFLVIDALGRRVGTMAVPQASRVVPRLTEPDNRASLDAMGRLIFRGSARVSLHVNPDGSTAAVVADSAPLLRLDLSTGRLDSLTFLRTPRVTPDVGEQLSPTLHVTHSTLDPFQIVDDWAVLSDGSVAIVRGRDFHVDWIDRNGARRRTPPVPFQWHRLAAADKTRVLDSLLVVYKRDPEFAPHVTATGVRDSTVWTVVPARQVPDSLPPFGANTTRADLDGRLWVRVVLRPIPAGGAVYAIVDRSGALVDRVQLPVDYALAGFGRGVVYLETPKSSGGFALVRARIK